MANRKKSSVRREIDGVQYIRDHLYRMDNVIDRLVDDILVETDVDSILGLLGVKTPNEPVKEQTAASVVGISSPRYLVGLFGKKKELKRRLHALPSLTACILLTFTYRNIVGLFHRAYNVLSSFGGMFPTTFWNFGIRNIVPETIFWNFGIRSIVPETTTVKVDASLVKNFFVFIYSLVLFFIQALPVVAASHLYTSGEVSMLKEKMTDLVGPVRNLFTSPPKIPKTKDDLHNLLTGVQKHKTALSVLVLGSFLVTNTVFVAMDRASQAQLVREIQVIFKEAIDRKLKALQQEMVIATGSPARVTVIQGGACKKNKIFGSKYTRRKKWK